MNITFSPNDSYRVPTCIFIQITHFVRKNMVFLLHLFTFQMPTARVGIF